MSILNSSLKKLAGLLIMLISTTYLFGQSTYLNVLTETTVNLTQVNINSLDYLSVTTNNWQADRTYCVDVTGTFYNMSSVGRILYVDVSNVSSFDIYVQNSTAGRQYKVTIGSGSEQIITHGGTNCEYNSFNTGNTGNIRIKLEGSNGSVYPVKIVLHTAATCTAPSVFNVGGSTVICEGTANVTLDGSESSVTYALFKDNALVSGSEKAGTGSVLSWTVNESGTYTVNSTDANNYCELAMDGEAVIVIDNSGPEITSSNLPGATYTQNETATSLSVTATGATGYQWYSNSIASNVGGTLIPSAENNSYSPSTVTIGTTYYYVIVTGPCGDPAVSSVSGAIVVEEAPLCNELRLASDFTSGITNYTFSTGDVLHGVDATGASVVLPNRNTSNICGGAAYRVQLQYVVLEVKSTNINFLTVYGTSSGSSIRNISKLEVGSAFGGPYTEITDFNVVSNTINSTSCGELTIDNLNITANSFLRITFSGNLNLSGFGLCINTPTPTVSLTSGNNPATAMATVEMTPVVFTYTDVENDNNVISNWYTDNTYFSITTSPSGLAISKDTEAKTVTVSGTPTTVGTYYYKISVNEEDGNAIEGSVVVDPYVISNVGKNTLKAIVFDGVIIRNITKELIHVMDMSGRIIVSSDKDINMSTFNKGIYIIRGKSGVMKIALTR